MPPFSQPSDRSTSFHRHRLVDFLDLLDLFDLLSDLLSDLALVVRVPAERRWRHSNPQSACDAGRLLERNLLLYPPASQPVGRLAIRAPPRPLTHVGARKVAASLCGTVSEA